MMEPYEHAAEDCDGTRHMCPDCDGEGWVLSDCFEDTCCCLEPELQHDTESCHQCGGLGGWTCPDAFEGG